MKYLTLPLLLAITSTCSAQVLVNGADINTQADINYVGVSVAQQMGGVIVAVDNGLPVKDFKHVQDPDGKPRKFNTTIDALNFLYREGWVNAGGYTHANLQWFLLERRERK
jgi:hypothetical protein